MWQILIFYCLNMQERAKRIEMLGSVKADHYGIVEGGIVKVSAHGSYKDPITGVVKISELSDQELYEKCRQYGLNARTWSRKFAGLIPEVARRRLHKRRGFASIQQFGNMVGGLSEYTVDKILHLAEKLKDKPRLLAMLESGEEGWSKIAKVAYVATVETDEMFAEKIKILPTRALEAFVQNYRGESVHVNTAESKNQTSQGATSDGKNGEQVEGQAGTAQVDSLFGGENIENNLGLEDYQRFSFPVSGKVDMNLRAIKQHLEKKTKESLTWNQVFETVIDKMEVNRPQLNFKKCPVCEQKATVTVCEGCAKGMLALKENGKKLEDGKSEKESSSNNNQSEIHGKWTTTANRNIPVETKRFLQLKYGATCGFPQCKNAWVNLHHTRRFALNSSHDPKYIVPLCKIHHDLAHAGMIENEQLDPANWSIRNNRKNEQTEELIDQKVREFKDKTRRGLPWGF